MELLCRFQRRDQSVTVPFRQIVHNMENCHARKGFTTKKNEVFVWRVKEEDIFLFVKRENMLKKWIKSIVHKMM